MEELLQGAGLCRSSAAGTGGQRLREEHCLQRIANLEGEVNKLRNEIATASQHAPKTPSAGIGGTHHHRNGRSCDTGPSRQRKRSKKANVHAKIGALPAIRPGEKDWQVVATRRNRTARVDTRNNKPELARLTPARATDKDSRRLPFRREGGLDGPKAPREEIILAINRGLARNGLPTFLRVVDSG